MISPWKNPLPLEEYTTSRVVVYFYSGRWVPIMYSRLADAITLYRKAQLEGKELVIFPPDLDPTTSFTALFTEPPSAETSQEHERETSLSLAA